MSLDDWNDGWLEGQQDMLAKCIAAVETMTEDIDATVWVERFYEDENDPEKITLMISLDETLEAMRALLKEKT